MEKYNKLEYGENKIVLLANTTKSTDYFFSGNLISVYLIKNNRLSIIMTLESLRRGKSRGMPINNKVENVDISEYDFLNFKFNSSEIDIELKVIVN